jgi:dTDP-glucose pyrophosphorylase
MPCTLVIPAAGESERFKPFCGDLPKGLLRFTWREQTQTMVEHCIPRGWKEHVYVVVRDEHATSFLATMRLDWKDYSRTVFSVKETLGQADTVQQVVNVLPVDEEILVVNCDNGFENTMEMFLTACRRFTATAGAVVMPGRGCKRYGYVDDYPYFHRAVEKTAISNYALAGAFYFKNKQVFLSAYEACMVHQPAQERYISSLFEYIPRPKIAYHIAKKELHEWGTPELLTADYSVTNIEKRNVQEA